MNFICKKCNTTFANNSNLKRHLNKKISCEKPKKERNCDICNIKFVRPSEYERHKKTKKHIININNIDIDIGIDNSTNNYINIKNIIQISELNTFVKTDTTVIDYEDIKKILNNIYIKRALKEFKEEDLTDDDYIENYKLFIMSLFKIFQSINFNKDYPENHNCKILAFYNTTDNLITLQYLILDKDLQNLFYWNQITCKEFIDKLLKLMNILKDHINNKDLTFIINHLNENLKEDAKYYNELKKNVEDEFRSLSETYTTKKVNFNSKNEIDKFYKEKTKLITGEQPEIKYIE